MQKEELERDERLTLLYILLSIDEGGVAEIDTEELAAIGVRTDPERVLLSLEEMGLIEIMNREKSGADELSHIVGLLDSLVTGYSPGPALRKEFSIVLLFVDLYERRDTALRLKGDPTHLQIAARIDELLKPYRDAVRSTNLVSRVRSRLSSSEDLLEYERAILYLLPIIGKDALTKPLTYDGLIFDESLIEEVAEEGIYVLDEEALNYRIEELEQYLNVVKEALSKGSIKDQVAANLLSGLIYDKDIVSHVAKVVQGE